jgi:hypothetical protein
MPNNQPFRAPSQPDDRRNYDAAGLIGFVKSSFTAGWMYLMKLGRGTSITTYQAVTGINAEIASGTAAAPLTAAAPVMKVSGTFNQSKASIYGGNAGITEGSTAITAEVTNTSGNDTQIAAIMASAQNTATTAGADAVGIFAIGFASGSGGTNAIGGYLQGQCANTNVNALGLEVRSQNESGSDASYTGGFDKAMGIWVTSNGTGAKKSATAIAIANAGSAFRAGISIQSSSVSDYSIDDGSSSTTAYRLQGSHTTGLDLSLATISGNAISLASGHTISGGSWTQSAWVAMTGGYTNSWVDFGGGYMAGAYMKDTLGFVHLRGLIKSGTMSTSAFTLPAGFRPSATVLMPSSSNNLYAQLEVASSGTITPTVGVNNYISLNGITFDTR